MILFTQPVIQIMIYLLLISLFYYELNIFSCNSIYIDDFLALISHDATPTVKSSIGTVKHLHMNHSKPLLGKIYVKFDDPKAGNYLKDRRLRGEIKECVPISATTKHFPFTTGNTTINV